MSALRLLSYRERTVKELKGRLLEKGFFEDEIGEVIAHLTDAGYLNDERYARSLVESRIRNKRWGRVRIRADLQKRGVPEDLIKAVLSELDETTETDTAREAYKKWLRKSSAELPLDRKTFARAFRHLAALGFSQSVIITILEEAGGRDGYGRMR